ncbi:MAG TPA: ASKHA domain-containing protein [Streptosporangiaceae bacterium]|nr:ASKHA domain-containing protein [Streptosporangiaceae bacterium]
MPVELCRVDFEPIGMRVDVPAGTTLLEAAHGAGVELASVCGGHGWCGRCRVAILAGDAGAPADADRRYLSPDELAAGRRLACRTHVAVDTRVHVPRASLVTGQRLQIGGVARDVAVEAAVRGWEVETAPPTLTDHRSDVDRVADGLHTAHGLGRLTAEPAVVRQISPLARRTGWRLAAYVRAAGLRPGSDHWRDHELDHEIVGVGPPGRGPLGLAVDLGTTKIAGYLVDLETGAELAAAGVPNPQIAYGEDVIARLAYAARQAGGADRLAGAARAAIDDLAGSLAEEAGAAREQIAEVSVVGNTAMHHLFLGLPTRQLSMSPFVAATARPLDVRARDLGLDLAPGCHVQLPPCVSGFVGADHVAMVLATGLDRADRVAVGLDIGTNTEIALCRPGRPALSCASCASGPAFEGAHIRDGMRAATGAIEGVRLTARGAVLRTVRDAPPVGICGSGIVEAIAELRRGGLVDERGRLCRDAPGVRLGRDGPEFLLAPAADTGTGRDIVVTQGDIEEIQLAKGAVHAGVGVVLEATGTDPAAVDEVIVAGAFGTYLDLGGARDIGLLPRLPHARYRQVGNAAGSGAKAVLLSLQERDRARRVALDARYIELTTFPGFQRRFAHSMWFPAVRGAGDHRPSDDHRDRE